MTCLSTDNGIEYKGDLNTAVNRQKCIRWDSMKGHDGLDYIKDDNFPDGSVSGAMNKCRNPGGEKDTIWCFVNADKDWKKCHVPSCPGG